MMKTIHSAYFWRISSFSGGEQTYFRASVPPTCWDAFYGFFGGLCGTKQFHLKSILIMTPHNRE